MHRMRLALFVLMAGGQLAASSSIAVGDEPANPFFAMDTYTKRPYPKNDIPPAAQLDMLRELGYQGIAWTEEPAEDVKAVLVEADARGLKMFAIYFGATATVEGNLLFSPQLPAVMDVLEGRDVIIWLHIGGAGPKIDELTADSAIVKNLRALADAAASRRLKIALYPHVGDWTERLEEADRVARQVDRPNLGVTFNLCHALAVGDEARIPALIEEAAPRLMIATINGADAGVDGAQWGRLIQLLGQGDYDVAIVLRALEKIGFKGPIGVQGFGIGGDRRENLERSIQAWRALTAKAPGPR